MRIEITFEVEVPNIPRKFKYLTVDENGVVSLWETEPQLNTKGWEVNFKKGLQIGEIDVTNLKVSPSIYKLEE